MTTSRLVEQIKHLDQSAVLVGVVIFHGAVHLFLQSALTTARQKTGQRMRANSTSPFRLAFPRLL